MGVCLNVRVVKGLELVEGPIRWDGTQDRRQAREIVDSRLPSEHGRVIDAAACREPAEPGECTLP